MAPSAACLHCLVIFDQLDDVLTLLLPWWRHGCLSMGPAGFTDWMHLTNHKSVAATAMRCRVRVPHQGVSWSESLDTIYMMVMCGA